MPLTDRSPKTDLTLMSLSPTEIAALDDDDWWDYEDQLQHHCIRLAWKKAFIEKLPVRACLNVIYAKMFIASERARGNAINGFALSQRLEELRQRHELVLCFGFFVDSEADRIMRGATESSYPSNVSILTPKLLGLKKGEHRSYILSALHLRLLRRLLAMKGRPHEDGYDVETLRIVGCYAQGPNHAHRSPHLEKLIEIVEKREAYEMGLANAVRTHMDSRLKA